ncbi:hypothetical protein Sjap_020220 [Stephania japonica]|uniref:Uncharacterized protein n=1 Tax=Stephania japonica TaxID=461633 RepID=A0AAP0F0A5_9MAGN
MERNGRMGRDNPVYIKGLIFLICLLEGLLGQLLVDEKLQDDGFEPQLTKKAFSWRSYRDSDSSDRK